MTGDRAVFLMVAFVLGMMVRDVFPPVDACKLPSVMDSRPPARQTATPPAALACAHYQAIGQGWKCT